MESVREPTRERLARAYPGEVGKGLLVYMDARRGLGLNTEKLADVLLDDKIVGFAATLRPSNYDGDIILSLALIGVQDGKLLGPALKLADQMRRYPDDCMHALSAVSEVLALSMRLKGFKGTDAFDGLAVHVLKKIGDVWKSGEIEKTFELIDKLRDPTDDPAGVKSTMDCEDSLNEIAGAFGYALPTRGSASEAGYNDIASRILAESDIYRNESYDSYGLTDVQKQALAAIIKLNDRGDLNGIAGLMGKSQTEALRALDFLSSKSLVSKNGRTDRYSAMEDGRLYARQYGLGGRREEP